MHEEVRQKKEGTEKRHIDSKFVMVSVTGEQVMSFTPFHVSEGRVNGFHASRDSHYSSRCVTQLY